MQFHGMADDKLSISTNGQAWRPPDHIIFPADSMLRKERTIARDDELPNKRLHLKRQKKTMYGKQANPSKIRGAKTKEVNRANEKNRIPPLSGKATLPMPSTCIQYTIKLPKRSFYKRNFALCTTALMAVGILVGLLVYLRKELCIPKDASRETDAESAVFRQPYHLNQRHSEMYDRKRLHGRKIRNFNDDDRSSKVARTGRFASNQGMFAEFLMAVPALQYLMKSIALGPAEPLPVTASIMYNIIPETLNGASPAPIISRHHRRANVKLRKLQGASPTKGQQPLGEYLTSARLGGKVSARAPERTSYSENQVSFPVERIHNTIKTSLSHTPGLSNANPKMHSDVLHSSALNVVEHVQRGAVSSGPNLRSPKTASDMKADDSNANSAYSEGGSQVPLPLQQRGATPETVEVWSLAEGKSLCRLFNVARLSDGRLVLPKWMKMHSEYLHSRCGIKGPIYAVERVSSKGTVQFDKKVLEKAVRGSFELDETNSKRDLCGTSAPRNHMPHFVTDIFILLVVSETLLGSGRMTLPHSSLHPNRTFQVGIRSASELTDFKPSMLVFDETWKRPSSDWVPRLVQFFKHPAIGFSMVRAGSEKGSKLASAQTPSTVSVFRSVVSSNIENHFPYGLFDVRGQNVVLGANGISRSSAWTMNGFANTKCQIRITALTRKGPRALLRLQALENKLNVLSSTAGIHSNFQVVDFEEKSFDDQVRIMQETNILITTHGAGNANFIFLKPSAAVIEIFPFAYKAGPFDSFARIFGLEYSFAMSAPQTDVFKECMRRHEHNQRIKGLAFSRWDKAVEDEERCPWIHRLEFEKEFGEPGKSEGMTTRMCVRLQELEFNIDAVSQSVIQSARKQCSMRRHV